MSFVSGCCRCLRKTGAEGTRHTWLFWTKRAVPGAFRFDCDASAGLTCSMTWHRDDGSSRSRNRRTSPRNPGSRRLKRWARLQGVRANWRHRRLTPRRRTARCKEWSTGGRCGDGRLLRRTKPVRRRRRTLARRTKRSRSRYRHGRETGNASIRCSLTRDRQCALRVGRNQSKSGPKVQAGFCCTGSSRELAWR